MYDNATIYIFLKILSIEIQGVLQTYSLNLPSTNSFITLDNIMYMKLHPHYQI